MLFSSFEFIFCFLPVTLIVYFLLNRLRLVTAANTWLLFASLVFYCWWNARYLPLILGSILFNYTIGHLMADSTALKKKAVSRKAIFMAGLSGNILLLGYFKYMDFFIGNVNALFRADLPFLHIVLPLGISFFTITQIAFLIDAYEGLVEEKALLNYALFVTFFPHLLAGPILHHKEMMPQFDRMRNKIINYRNLAAGLFLFLLGLSKKVLIADTLSQVANPGFDHAGTLNFCEAWLTSLSYTLQLYFDFSGYSDMAIGIGWMFNISLPINFNSPYKATNIIDFWKRWHITLTNFITTYVYTPILRSFTRVTFVSAMLAILVAMLVSGFWHGAGWTFIAWGGLHGLALVTNHVWKKNKLRMNPVLAWFITIQFVNVTFVFFRAKSWGDALKVLKGMVFMNGFVLPAAFDRLLGGLARFGVRFDKTFVNLDVQEEAVILGLVLALALFAKNSVQLTARDSFKPTRLHMYVVMLLFIVNVIFLNSLRAKEFLYFDF
jgi:alginate O-acetyltransferase complex protein AlgI